jgi:hypothetical protein
MLYPTNLPTASLLENLHRDKHAVQKKMRVFHIAFLVLFLWQAFPRKLPTRKVHVSENSTNNFNRIHQWVNTLTVEPWLLTSVVPLTAGISVFCLSMRHNLFVTNLFGGSMANEGLGVGAIALDWTTICRFLKQKLLIRKTDRTIASCSWKSSLDTFPNAYE